MMALRQHSAPNRLWSLRAIVGLVLLTACGKNPERPRVDQAAWQVDSVPLLDIGSAPDDTTEWIGVAEGVTMVGDSEIVVADRGFASLRYFDRTGAFKRAAGRAGSGPGEFDYIARLFHCGDSLVVQDIGSRQFMVFGESGAFARAYRPQGPAGARFDSPYRLACGPSGAFIDIGWNNDPQVKAPTRVRGTAPSGSPTQPVLLRWSLGNSRRQSVWRPQGVPVRTRSARSRCSPLVAIGPITAPPIPFW